MARTIHQIRRLDEDRFEVQYSEGVVPARKVQEKDGQGNWITKEETPERELFTEWEGGSLSHLQAQVEEYENQIALKAAVEAEPVPEPVEAEPINP